MSTTLTNYTALPDASQMQTLEPQSDSSMSAADAAINNIAKFSTNNINALNTAVLKKANNLSDVASASSARTNLGLSTPIAIASGGTGNTTATAAFSALVSGTVISGSNGGTGINNGGNTITLSANLTTAGSQNLTFTVTGATNVTLPTSGTLFTTAGGTLSGALSMGANKVNLDAHSFIQADGAGNVLINCNNPSGVLTIDAASVAVTNGLYSLSLYYPWLYKPIITSTPPASATDTGTQWTITDDAHFIYICTATNTWEKIGLVNFVTLAFATPLATDCSTGSNFEATLTSNFTLANPTNAWDGQPLCWRLIQDATGGRTITLGTNFNAGSLTITLSTAANKTDYLRGVYRASTGKVDILEFVKGY